MENAHSAYETDNGKVLYFINVKKIAFSDFRFYHFFKYCSFTIFSKVYSVNKCSPAAAALHHSWGVPRYNDSESVKNGLVQNISVDGVLVVQDSSNKNVYSMALCSVQL